VWAEASHAPVAVRDPAGVRHPTDWLVGRRVAAFAGIGNPSAFRQTLTALGAEVVAFRPYADHHAYSPADRADLAAWARGHGAEGLVTTLKDLVKIPAGVSEELPIQALEIALVVESGATALGSLVDRLAMARPPAAGKVSFTVPAASPR
jgi:tetraacyldisaccharide 4'-kinase